MQIILEIIKGTRIGRNKPSFIISCYRPDNITVGRAPRKSEKFSAKYPHIQISPDDLRLSRWHFMIQVRPPNCFICDIGSTNHTYVNDFKKGQHIKDSIKLKHGDVIKAGRTYLKTHIMAEEPKEISKYYCTRCKKELKDVDRKPADDIGAKDFICEECRKKEPAVHRWMQDSERRKRRPLFGWLRKEMSKDEERATVAEEKQPPAENMVPLKEAEASEIRCSRCGRNMMEQANKDRKAQELRDVAIYLCEDCAVRKREDKKKISDYLILREIGKGGMGVVYEAWHKPTGRLVAMKELLSDNLMDDKNLKLFHREISVTRELTHPNIVRFYDSFTKKRTPYLVTEYMPGGNAEDRLLKQKGPFPTDEACRIILDILEGLSWAHKRGIVHRDIKPQNILFDKEGQAKLSDMGLAKSFEQAGQSGITTPGETGGTPLYMAPEQILDFCFVKPPADIYSVGVCLYYFLTGKFPFHFPSRLDVLMGLMKVKKAKHSFTIVLEEDPIPILERKPDLPKALAYVIDKCLKKKPEYRFGNAKDLREAMSKAGY